jgi:hypothetical protein
MSDMINDFSFVSEKRQPSDGTGETNQNIYEGHLAAQTNQGPGNSKSGINR